MKGAKNKTLKTAFRNTTCASRKGATNLTLNYLRINPERKSWWPLQTRLPRGNATLDHRGPQALTKQVTAGHKVTRPLMGGLEASP